jgi:hypothetical protein
MVENTNSIILEVQWSFGLTYMVKFILLNLRSQEMDKGVPHARAPPPPARPGPAHWHLVHENRTISESQPSRKCAHRAARGQEPPKPLPFETLHGDR